MWFNRLTKNSEDKRNYLSVTVNGAEVADCRKVKCRLTRFWLRRNKNSKITKEYFNLK